MQVLTEPLPLPPGICFICQLAQPKVRFVDTALNAVFFHPDGGEQPTHLSGRKYVCEICVEEMARLLGFVREEEVAEKLAEAESAKKQFQLLLSEMRDVLANYTS